MTGDAIIRTMVGGIALTTIMAATAAAQAAIDTSAIMVYVTAPSRGGFIDTSKDIQDTVNDLRNRVKSAKTLDNASAVEAADVILTVVKRGVGSEEFGQRLDVYRNYYGGASLMALPVYANTRWISTVLEVGEYKQEFSAAETNSSAYSLGAWGDDADRIIKDVRAWLSENDATVRARRKK